MRRLRLAHAQPVKAPVVGLLTLAIVFMSSNHAWAIATMQPGARATETVTKPTRSGSFTARLVTTTAVRARPGRGAVLMRINPAVRPSTLMALGERTERGQRFIKVHISRRGARTGWLPASHVVLARQPWFIEINRSQRRLSLYHRGRLHLRTRVIIGAPSTPTPAGLFALHHIAPNEASSPLGPYTLQLTAFSDVLHEFAGGPGRIAIHGMRGALVVPLGSRVSHGCVRVPNRTVRRLAARSRMGTPVFIRRGST